MDASFEQLWHELLARPDGPLALRFYLQPLVALLLATRDGVRDARAGRPAYFWALFKEPEHRRERLRDGWSSIGKVFVIALVLDTVYQVIVFKGLRPVAGLIVAIVLAIVPYVLLRGPVNRLARRVPQRRRAA
jgi:hypothetical protein